jgi:hypothetical protein
MKGNIERCATTSAPPPDDVGCHELVTSTLSSAPFKLRFYRFPHVHEVWRSFSRHRHSNKTVLEPPVHVHFFIRSRQQLLSHSLGLGR